MRGSRSAEAQWEKYGQIDPYFGVLSHAEYHRDQLTDEALERFFETGRTRVDDVVRMAAAHASRPLELRRVMDFGCGVGRLLIALGEHADHVVGVDISPSMLAEARTSCDRRGLGHAELIQTPQLQTLKADFDLIHSHIVFQHIPPREGYALFERLVGLLAPGGIGVLHFTLSANNPLLPVFTWMLKRVPLAASAWNLARGRDRDYPTMEMNRYDLERLLQILGRHGIRHIGVEYHRAKGPRDLNSAVLVFERPLPTV
jgi:SAM-dependent methyltransferase